MQPRDIFLIKKKLDLDLLRQLGKEGESVGLDPTHWALEIQGEHYHLDAKKGDRLKDEFFRLDPKKIPDSLLVKWEKPNYGSRVKHKVGETSMSYREINEAASIVLQEWARREFRYNLFLWNCQDFASQLLIMVSNAPPRDGRRNNHQSYLKVELQGHFAPLFRSVRRWALDCVIQPFANFLYTLMHWGPSLSHYVSQVMGKVASFVRACVPSWMRQIVSRVGECLSKVVADIISWTQSGNTTNGLLRTLIDILQALGDWVKHNVIRRLVDFWMRCSAKFGVEIVKKLRRASKASNPDLPPANSEASTPHASTSRSTSVDVGLPVHTSPSHTPDSCARIQFPQRTSTRPQAANRRLREIGRRPQSARQKPRRCRPSRTL